MFRIKICGITRVDDAIAVAEAGADAIGLNFFPRSPRYVTPAAARIITKSLPPHVSKVGVFVNESADSILRIAEELALEFVQLHGDEPPESLARLAPRRVIRAFRITDDFEPLLAYLHTCHRFGCSPAAVLVDAMDPGKYGGTGKIANWDKVGEFRSNAGGLRTILAGGLAPGNVAEAIRRVRPAAVDVASGVECAPGRKDPALIARFVRAALSAWEDGSREDR